MKSDAHNPSDPYPRPSEGNQSAFIPLSFFPPRLNDYLSHFFAASSGRSRFYQLLLALWRHQSVRTANAMAFDLFLALIPMLGVAGWGTSLLLQNESEKRSDAFSALAPAELHEFLEQHFEALAASRIAPFAALIGWWISSSAFNTMMGVFEEAFDCVPRRWWRRRLVGLVFSLIGMMGLALAGTLGVLLTMAPSLVGFFIELLARSGLFTVALVAGAYLAMTSFLALLFRYSIRRPGWQRRVWPGAFLASTVGTAASVALGYYAGNIARYALFYGGLAVIVIVLIWLWLWSSAIVIGAELNIALEDIRQERQST